jgi:tetratricopeptide (TPR) repeat protein
MTWLLASCCLLAAPPTTIQRIGVLPLVEENAEVLGAGWLIADMAGRALATDSLADVPKREEIATAIGKLGGPLSDAAASDGLAAARALDLDYFGRGWVRPDGDTIVADVEVWEVARGARLCAQTFRADRGDLPGSATLIASRISEAVLGHPLLSYALEAVRPPGSSPAALRFYGRGLAALDQALGALARRTMGAYGAHLTEASNRLADAVNSSPSLLWPYDALLDASGRIIDMNPTVGAAYINIAVAKQALGDLGGAMSILRRGTDAATENPVLRVALANVVLEAAGRGVLDRDTLRAEAKAAASKATLLDPSLPAAWTALGAACFDSGQYEEALAAYLRSATLAPLDAVAELGAGLSLLRLGRWEEAQGHLRRVLDLDAGPLAARAKEELQRIAGRP